MIFLLALIVANILVCMEISMFWMSFLIVFMILIGIYQKINLMIFLMTISNCWLSSEIVH